MNEPKITATPISRPLRRPQSAEMTEHTPLLLVPASPSGRFQGPPIQASPLLPPPVGSEHDVEKPTVLYLFWQSVLLVAGIVMGAFGLMLGGLLLAVATQFVRYGIPFGGPLS
ncbi:hypothetical protein LTS18_007136 [Coniosporium uncinatum]|uniref:Uncharacterized protein n=1 Tax=Coniosporium uncinatum TaxID=93489 RepID=A0ACC3DPL1_9PEZI|nr:hypothetical protein LTS18_007136 [Coniosporium uncinatum]